MRNCFIPRSSLDDGAIVLILGTPYARFHQFVRRPADIMRYLIAMLSG